VTVRWLRFWKLVRASDQRDSPELDAMLQTLSKQLGVRRRVRLIVTESLVGPAVVGFFRVTVLLPAVVADKLQGKSVEPILAHELLHIRRGDLWVGLLQTVAQALWWFHPLVWWAGRVTSREAERCCDEEVLGELKCDPASYARALLDVLDLKSQLKPVPVFPGVRPVDVTSQRLERIMSLRQGCRRRSPWWCWLLAIGAAALTLPGAAFVVTAQEAPQQAPEAAPHAAVVPQPAALPDGSSGPSRPRPETPQLNVLTPADRDGPTRSTILTARMRRLTETPNVDAKAVTGIGVNSAAVVAGKVVLNPIPTPAASRTVPAIQQASTQNVEPIDAAGQSKTPTGLLLTRRPLGSLFLTLRNRGDGSVSPRMTVRLADAEGNDVLTGTADDVQINETINETKLAQTVEMTDTKLQTVGTSEQRFSARRLRLVKDHRTTDKSGLRMELDTAEVQFESSGRVSKLTAERIELQLRFEPFVVEEVQAKGLGSLKADAPVNLNDQPVNSQATTGVPGTTNAPKNRLAKPSQVRQQTPEAGATRLLKFSRTWRRYEPSPPLRGAELRLRMKASVDFKDAPLSEVLNWARKTSGLNLVVDPTALKECGVSLQTPVTVWTDRIMLESTLRLVLEPLGLGVRVNHDFDDVVITSKSRIPGRLVAAA
jgi:hypothetical protein